MNKEISIADLDRVGSKRIAEGLCPLCGTDQVSIHGVKGANAWECMLCGARWVAIWDSVPKIAIWESVPKIRGRE